MGEDKYMKKSLDDLHTELEQKKRELSRKKREFDEIESDIVGIKEAIRTKSEKTNSFVKKFGNENN